MIARRRTHREAVEIAETPLTLVGEAWTVAVGGRTGGAGYTYHRPSHVEAAGAREAIHDYVMLTRLASLLIVAVAVLTRRFRHG